MRKRIMEKRPFDIGFALDRIEEAVSPGRRQPCSSLHRVT
jgi:hypothetical protein